MRVAAIFVGDQPGDPYMGLNSVDVWGVKRDARNYIGPWPVVAHPPCERWGRYWGGGPSAKIKRRLGDDGGCFAHAINIVRKYGGVLEHPEASHAWPAFGVAKPPRTGGWVQAGDGMGWTCCVAQGHYGHPAQKLTWLYAVGCKLPDLRWGLKPGCVKMEDSYRSTEHRARAKATGQHTPVRRLTARERWATPEPFRDILLSMAWSVG